MTALKKKEKMEKQVTVHPLHNSPHPSVKIGEVALVPLVRFFLEGTAVLRLVTLLQSNFCDELSRT